MRTVSLKFPRLAALTLCFGALLSAAATPPRHQAVQQTAVAPAAELVLSIDPAQSKVHWTVDSTLHMVHGTFSVERGALHVDRATGHVSGEVVVNTVSGDSGNNSRDDRMHKEILETAKFPDAAFRPTQLDGQLPSSGLFDGNLRGVLSIHGAEHDLVAPVHADITGAHWKGTAKFEIPYVQWGIKNPSNFFLKVKPVVNVELELSGTLTPPK
jgi:polyisoprenoid-binding protein YceI